MWLVRMVGRECCGDDTKVVTTGMSMMIHILDGGDGQVV